ncbi:MAG: hypothetical protein KAG66_07355, partial [Methylococcales bacterium]|nr:hypothetical protein [Methylococcales bacterium]
MLLASVALIAGIFRLYQLTLFPLSPTEATEALTIWQVWHPTHTAIIPGSPAYFSTTTLLSLFLGSGDGVMRLMPAFFGTALTLLPWLLRHHIGTVGTLVAGLILAISPTATNISRTAGGGAMAMFAVMLTIIALIRYLDTPQSHWLTVAFAAFSFGLATTPIFYGAIATFGVAWLIQRVIGPVLINNIPHPSTKNLRQAILVSAGIFLATTLFLWIPAGLGSATNQFSSWLVTFTAEVDINIWINPILVLLRYEPIIFIIGAIAAITITWQGQPLTSLFVYWVVAILIFTFFQPGNLDNVLLVLIPASRLIGYFANIIANLQSQFFLAWQYTVSFAAIILLMGGVFFAMIARHAKVVQFDATDLIYMYVAIAIFAFALATVAYLFAFDKTMAAQGSFAGIFTLLLLFTWGTSWWLNQQATNDTRARWVNTHTDDDITIMLTTLNEIGMQTARSERSLDILTAIDTPVLRWYLRDIPNISYNNSVPAGTTADIVITPIGADPNFGTDYMGADFGLLRHNTP